MLTASVAFIMHLLKHNIFSQKHDSLQNYAKYTIFIKNNSQFQKPKTNYNANVTKRQIKL